MFVYADAIKFLAVDADAINILLMCTSLDKLLPMHIQLKLLNVITDNVINRLILSEFLIPARTYYMHYK